MNIIEQFSVGRFEVEIFYDEFHGLGIEDILGENDTDSSVIVCSFNRNSVVSGHNPFQSIQSAREWAGEKDYFVFKMMRYQHGQTLLSAFPVDQEAGYPFNCPFDAGMEGLVLVKKGDGEEVALELANNYLSELTDWCNGSVYGFNVKDSVGDILDSCYGIVGMESVEDCARQAANDFDDTEPKQFEMGMEVEDEA